VRTACAQAVVFLGCQSGSYARNMGLGMHKQSTHFMKPFSSVGQLFCCSILGVHCKGRKENVIL